VWYWRLTNIGDQGHVVHEPQTAGLEQCLRAVVAELLRNRRRLLEVVRLDDDFVKQNELSDEIAEVDYRWIILVFPRLAGDRAQESVAWLHPTSMRGVELRTHPRRQPVSELFGDGGRRKASSTCLPLNQATEFGQILLVQLDDGAIVQPGARGPCE
jgi:hypothetical protein